VKFYRSTVWTILAFLSVAAAPAQPAQSAESVVRAYTDAANRGDLEAFLDLYDPQISKYRFPAQLTSQGIAHNRETYARSFAANPNLKVEIVELVALGDKVMVHDRVTGLASGQTAEELTVYQVQNGRISDILYVERITSSSTR
jgi:hypothetical protein